MIEYIPILAITQAILPIVASLAATGIGAAMAAGNRPKYPTRSIGNEIDEILARRGAILASDKSYQPEQARLEREIAAESVFGKDEAKKWAEAGSLEASMEEQRRLNQFDIGQARELAPQVMDIYQQNVPYSGLLKQIQEEASRQLAAGAGLDTATAAQVRQQARAGLAERGLGTGLAEAMAETSVLGAAGEALRRQRQQFALQALQGSVAATPDLFRLITGRETGINQVLMGRGGQTGSGDLGNLFQYASQVFGDNLRKRLFETEVKRQHTNQMAGALGALGGILGKAQGGSFSSL